MRIVVIGAWAPALITFRGPLLRAMVERGHEVIAMAPDGSEAVRVALAKLGVGFEELRLQRAGTDPLADLGTLVALTRRLRALRPDLVFGYTIKPILYGTLAARLARVPRRAVMITGLGYAFTRATDLRGRAVGLIATTLYRRALAACQTVFFQNPDDLAEFQRHRLLAPASRVSIVRGSGVDLDHYKTSALPAGPTVFLFVGRLLRDKGVYDFVAAARRLRARRPDTVFRIAGWLDPNPESVTTTELDAWIQEGVIEYLGAIADIRPTLAAAHVLVLPSYREGTPRSVLEAMSMGRAVITTDAPGCRETIIDGESGLLVPVADPEALELAMHRLCSDRPLLARLAMHGHARATALYDARIVARGMLDAMAI
jgi:glycosyltransferase involved in cell wall biosynthesis